MSVIPPAMAGEDGEPTPSYVTQEQLQKLVQDFNDQLYENMVAAQKNTVAEVVKAAQGAQKNRKMLTPTFRIQFRL